MGTALIMAGFYAWLVRATLTGPLAGIVVASGAVIATSSYWYTRPNRFPDYIEVHADELRLGWDRKPNGIILDFEDTGVKFTLRDSSGMRRVGDPQRQAPDYSLMPYEGNPVTPIPKVAFDEILELARRSGLIVQRNETAWGMGYGSTVEYRIARGVA